MKRKGPLHRVAIMPGGWGVYLGSELISGPADTNAAAWRLADRLNMEAKSRAEELVDWVFEKSGE